MCLSFCLPVCQQTGQTGDVDGLTYNLPISTLRLCVFQLKIILHPHEKSLSLYETTSYQLSLLTSNYGADQLREVAIGTFLSVSGAS